MTVSSVDIALCTWNRADLLAKTLQSFSSLDVPERIELSIILVDNNSTDETESVVDEFSRSSFADQHRFLCAKESKQGHTFARNRAIAESSADLIVWTDDDVVVPQFWVERYIAAANSQPEASFWGGEIVPFFEGGKPKWIENNWNVLSGCFAARDMGSDPVEFSSERLPYGANFAVRGDVQRKNLFDVELGRREHQVVGEDEIEMMQRLIAGGHRGFWVPDAGLRHLIPSSRSNVEYVYNYFVGQGSKLALKGSPWHRDLAKLKSESKSEYRKFWLKRFFRPCNEWCSHLVRSGLAFGQWRVLNNGNCE